jgi:diacylglycerol O-acyltransferase / wax synthase
MAETLSALDATFLELEEANPGALMSIGGTMVFEAPDGRTPSVEELREVLAQRIEALPRYTQRLSTRRTGRFALPHWETDPQFDIRHHVRHAALPAPGGDRELCEWTADFFSHPLDRARPLWELVLLEGLEHGRWALAHKVHHCLVDGVGSVDIVGLLVDDQPNAGPARAPHIELTTSGADRHPARRPHPPDALAQAAGAGAHASRGALHSALHPRDAVERSRALLDLLVQDEVIGAPHTSLNIPIGQTRRFALVRAGSLAELKAIGRELGGSFNDVMLAACTGGLRRLLIERGERLPDHGLRAMVPVNIRVDAKRLELGNRVSSLFVDLPVAEPLAAVRFAQIATRTQRLKSGRAARGPTTMLDLAALAPPIVTEATVALTAFSTRLFNVTITNVPGSPDPVYALGAKMREVLPIVPLAADHAVGIAIFTYNGTVTIGINADCDSMPDLDVLARGIEESLGELGVLGPAIEAADYYW